MAPRHPLRSHIVALFRRGEIASVAEAVLICDASRQAVTKWLRAEGIDCVGVRLAYITRQRTRAMQMLDAKPAWRRPTKIQMREEVGKAVRRFNVANSGSR